MKPTTKATLAAGATVASMVASITLPAVKAEAEPVVSSWYGTGLEGNATASGEVFTADGDTAAHPNLPFGTELLVTYGGGRRSCGSMIGARTLTAGAWISPGHPPRRSG